MVVQAVQPQVQPAPAQSTKAPTSKALHEGEIPQAVLDLVKKQPGRLFINGEYADAASGKTYENICPLNGQSLGKVAEGDAEDIDVAVRAARAAFEDGPWGQMSARERGRLLNKFADAMEEHLIELATLEAIDNGKAFAVARDVDVTHVVDCFRYFAGCAVTIQGATIDTGDGTLCSTYKEPMGVVGAVIPWNFPLAMFAWKVAPGLAAGCTMVIKCAEQTPLTALRAAELATAVGIPPGVINVVPGFGPTAGAALACHPDVDKICFTGSTEVGKLIMHAAADTVKNISLELGGKSPLIVAEDADVEVAARVAHMGLFFNAGQCCCAASRVFVHEAVYDEFQRAVTASARAIKVGNPFQDDTAQGPQVDIEQFDKVMHYIKLGQEQGATMLCGGARAHDGGYYIQPTIFADVEAHMAIAQDEIFGPVMACSRFTDLDDAIKRANDTQFGLAAGVCSTNINTINQVMKKLRAGTIWVNTWNQLDCAAPFGGYKQSGIHRDKGLECLDNYLETKCVMTAKP